MRDFLGGLRALGTLVLPTSTGVPSTTENDGAIKVDTSNSNLYFRSAGAWVKANGGGSATVQQQITFSIIGTPFIGTSPRFYFANAATISKVLLSAGVAPVGAPLVFDVLKNDTTVFTSTAKPSIAVSAFTNFPGVVPNVTSVASGEYLTISVLSTGTTIAGSDIVVTIIYT